jgi:hypothetical protein
MTQVIENDGCFMVPDIFFSELYSICHRAKIPFFQLYDLLKVHKHFFLVKSIFNWEYIETAEKICKIRHDKSGYPFLYDSLYHAIAMCEDVDFLTSDKKYHDKTKTFGSIVLLEDLF